MPACPKPRKQKKSERKRLDDECMEYLKQIVRLRDKTCVTSSRSCSGYICASHWQKRGKQKTRYSLQNVNAQCQACNQRQNHYTGPYDTYMLKHYGYDVCLELAEGASIIAFKWTIAELREIRDGLKKTLEGYESNLVLK
jgi:hypothetical protein